ncbi:hypothetical protein ACM26X_23885 [Kluyvera cryocrescens]|uniref:hypothetical protein n=1 Tax=Kluyvera cryocrescens TaxID=580 RepID=UPI0039F48DE7
MTALNKQALRDSALDMISVLGYIASFESEDIDGDDLELRFETEDGFDTGCTISITSQCQDASDVMQQLLNELEDAEKRIAELQTARDKCFMSGLKTGWEYGIADDTEGYNREVADAQAVIDRAAGIGVKGD